jgi:glycerol-3-phosphate acyltransferase PlsX
MESPKKLRIAIDAMGGDYAPEREIAGAIEALRTSNEKFEIILVGDEEALRRQLAAQKANDLPWNIVHASQIITMADPSGRKSRCICERR